MAVIFQDAFVGNAGILLDTAPGTTGRAITTGTGWVRVSNLIPGSPNSTASISSAGRVYNTSTGYGYYFTNPPSGYLMLDGDITMDVVLVGANQSPNPSKGMFFRANNYSVNPVYYSFQYNGTTGQMEFVRQIGAVYTVIQSFPNVLPAVLTVGVSYTLRAQVRGNLFTFYVNGVQLQAPAIPGIPANWVRDNGITAPGNWGLLTTGPDTDTLGVHADNFIVSDVPVITVTSPAGANLVAGLGAQTVVLAAAAPAGWSTGTLFQLFATPGLTGAVTPVTVSSPDASHITLSINPGTTIGSLSIIDPNGGVVTLNVISNVTLSTIVPATPTVLTTATVTFSTSVSGNTSGNNAVTWTTTGGSITTGGVYTPPAVAGVYSVTATSVFDPSKFTTMTLTVVVPPGAPVVTMASSLSQDVVSVPATPLAGTNALTTVALYPTDVLGNVTGAALSTLTPASYPVSFPAQAAPAPGSFKYYGVRAGDASGFLSALSNTVGRGTTLVAPSSPLVTYLRTFTAPYGSGASGQALGYSVFDLTGAILAPRTTSGVAEIPGTGIFVARALLDTAWSGVVVWDAPAGGGPYVESFDAPDKLGYALSARGMDAVTPPADITSMTAARSSYWGLVLGMVHELESAHNEVIATGGAATITIANWAGATIGTRTLAVSGATTTLSETT